jgi:glycosyltransferase involved in cell wall biosynthesis
MKKISIIVPIFNEEKNLKKIFKKLFYLKFKGCKKEIIAINDGSTDRSPHILKKFKKIKIFSQKNQGKGKAVQLGISKAIGSHVVIQDSDLEYTPRDIIKLYDATKNLRDVSIYGSRYLPLYFGFIPKYYKGQNLSSYFANIIFIILFFILYQRIITDPLTGYKLYEKKFFKNNLIKSKGFEADHEITAKLIKKNYKIIEIPINYKPRTKAEGKKINFFDGLKALYTIIIYRFIN